MEKIAHFMVMELPSFMDVGYLSSFMWYLESTWPGRHLSKASLEDFEVAQIKNMNFTKFCGNEEIALIPIATEQFPNAPRTNIAFAGQLGSVMREVDNQLIRMTEDDRRARTGYGVFPVDHKPKLPMKVR